MTIRPHHGLSAALQDGPQPLAVARGPHVPAVVLEGLLRLIEFLLIMVAGLEAHAVLGETARRGAVETVLSIAVAGIAVTILIQTFGGYALPAMRAPARFLPRLAAAWLLAATVGYGLTLTTGFVAPPYAAVLAWIGGGWLLTGAGRFAASVLIGRLSNKGLLTRRAVVVGGGEECADLLRAFETDGGGDVKIIGIFDDRADDRSPRVVAGYPKLGTVDDLVGYARVSAIDLVIVALPIVAQDRVLMMLKKLWVLPIDIRLATHRNKLRLHRRAYSYIGTVPFLDLFDRPVANWDFIVKTVFDRVVGTLCLVSFAPVMLVIAAAIKLDSPGPVFFRQKRYGFNNEVIEVFKFRSMFVDQSDYQAAKQVTRGDPRVTRVGRIIRKTSLDELPQLLNVVLKGNLSLVGPRPHAVFGKAADRFYHEVVEGYYARHRVKPGITGWAQVKGWRGETDTPEKIMNRVECDLYYIDNWTIGFDLFILGITPFALLNTKDAY